MSSDNKPLIMGILNITPDSFSDGGKFTQIPAALSQVAQMLADGADIIDIGGESTRPGSDAVAADEQIRRVIPIITAIRQQLQSDITISIDTCSSIVAQAALAAGANWINAVSAGQTDPAILTVAAQTGAPIILMHSVGTPKTMQDNPYYDQVVEEVLSHLQTRTAAALAAGISNSQIMHPTMMQALAISMMQTHPISTTQTVQLIGRRVLLIIMQFIQYSHKKIPQEMIKYHTLDLFTWSKESAKYRNFHQREEELTFFCFYL